MRHGCRRHIFSSVGYPSRLVKSSPSGDVEQSHSILQERHAYFAVLFTREDERLLEQRRNR
jgi:hypothetical protein